MGLVIVLLLLVLVAGVAAFGAHLVLGLDQAMLPSLLLAITIVLALLVVAAVLRGRDPFSRPALRLIRRRFPRSVEGERTRLRGVLAVSVVSAPRTAVGEGAVGPHQLVRRRLYLVLTSTSPRSNSLELWRWRRLAVVPAVVFDLSRLRGCELVDHDPDSLRSELPVRTVVLHFDGTPEPVVLWVRKGQQAVDLTRRVAEHVKRRPARGDHRTGRPTVDDGAQRGD